jgi:protein-histidine pros-kinase
LRLVFKFNLVLVLVFGVGLVGAGIISRRLLYANARAEVMDSARMIMASALASRSYTVTELVPLLNKVPGDDFIPQTVPAFGATEQFNKVHEQFPDFSYKEATINPTNLRDKATDWEADVVKWFRDQPNEKELVIDRETPTGATLSLARPIKITDEKCLVCHSTVDAAPKSMIEKYGPANGFGWQLNSIIGAQVVTVPTRLPIQRADAAFLTFMGSLAAIVVLVFVLINLMLMLIVVRPVTQLSKVADEVSMGKLDAPELPANGGDEVAQLGRSFNRMKKSLSHAIKMLEE